MSTTVGYLNYETSLMQNKEFKIGSTVTFVLVLVLCIMMRLAHRSVVFLRNKWHIYVQRKTIERKSSENSRTIMSPMNWKISPPMNGLYYDGIEIQNWLFLLYIIWKKNYNYQICLSIFFFVVCVLLQNNMFANSLSITLVYLMPYATIDDVV